MNGGSRATDQNYKAQLADDFNRFYLEITSRDVLQIGNYKVIEEIGEGAFGKVYLAFRVMLNLPVVLKCGLLDDPNIVREIYYHRQLKHKNIVRLYEVVKTETHLWMVMEYCQGNELYYHIYDKRRLVYEEYQQIFFQILQGIKYVHSLNLVHRDLKLENILFGDKKKNVVKLTDFGFVREFNPVRRNFLSTVCGTTVYMAPEMLDSRKYDGTCADIWSLGVILYTMVYGQMPFDEDDDLKTKYKIIHEEPIFNDSFPKEVNDIIKKMLNKQPMARPNINEILNSGFLIDITNKFPERPKRSSSIANDAESIMSINQHHNSGLPPFQSKVAKHLLKRLAKLNIRIDKLQQEVGDQKMTPLTAFYELALTKEYNKKKMRYYKEKRRRAKKSLKRSKKKVKSVLSMNDDGSQPLERIMSTLSLNSKAGGSKSNLPLHMASRKSSEKRRSTSGMSLDPDIFQSSNSTPPFNRTVSFHPSENERRNSITSALNSITDKRKKNATNGNSNSNNKIMNRLVFWKKKDDNNNDFNENKDQVSDITTTSPSPKTVMDDTPNNTQLPITNNNMNNNNNIDMNNEDTSVPLKPDHEKQYRPLSSSPVQVNPSNEGLRMKTRPSSMVSQISQISHLSQLSTMMSESELDILDESSMDEFEEDILYESSLNTSNQDFHQRPSSKSSKTNNLGPSRPSYTRQPSSDVSIVSTSTTTTSRQPLQSQKKPQLIHASSNSSDESESRIISPSPKSSGKTNRLKHHSKSPNHVIPYDTSPEYNTIQITIPRSSSPPLPSKYGGKNGEISNMYQAHSIINEEEEEEGDDRYDVFPSPKHRSIDANT